jgi:glyoxylase-like metal-dependent hydrolase (beta-lactamase superfamily II)
MSDIITIDCNYIMPQVAAAYLLRAGGKACFIDNNTNYAVPALLAALKNAGYKPEDVSHIIITHVHLDHAGATGLLLSHCPNAVVVAHPRAAPHVINPSRLVQSASAVYGADNFKKLYGEILPVPETRVYIPADGETMCIGDRDLEFTYTRGHANHHFVILDKKTMSIFTGDSFGIAYPLLQHGTHPFLFPTTTPTDFDAGEARISYDKILKMGAQRAYPTHFGVWTDMAGGHKMLQRSMDEIEGVFNKLRDGLLEGDAAYRFAFDGFKTFFNRELAERNISLTQEEEEVLNMDIDLNAQGLTFAAQRARKKSGKSAL